MYVCVCVVGGGGGGRGGGTSLSKLTIFWGVYQILGIFEGIVRIEVSTFC